MFTTPLNRRTKISAVKKFARISVPLQRLRIPLERRSIHVCSKMDTNNARKQHLTQRIYSLPQRHQPERLSVQAYPRRCAENSMSEAMSRK